MKNLYRVIENAKVYPLEQNKDNDYYHIAYDGFYPILEANLYRGKGLDFFKYKDRIIDKDIDFKVLKGVSVYLGIVDVHYGHAISEGLSRLHSFDFHKVNRFIFSYRTERHKNNVLKNKVYNALFEFLSSFGEVVFVDRCFECETLYVPKQLFVLGYSCDKSYFRNVVQAFNVKNIENNRMVYVSRERISDCRKYYDEKLLVEKLKEIGFDIVYPEDLGLSEQISIFSGCKFIVGMEGTALLNTIWNINENLKVISIGYRNQRNKAQRDLCSAKGAKFKLVNLSVCCNVDYIFKEISNALV